MKVAAIGITLLALACGNAFAFDSNYLSSEKAFRDAVGKRATRIADGVYEVRNPSGSISRFSFGEAGRAFEIGELEARLADLDIAGKGAAPVDRKLVNGLTDTLQQLKSGAVRVKAINSNNPPTHCVSGYALEATASPGFAYGSARANAGFTDFGPVGPHTKELHTFAHASSVNNMTSSHTQQYAPMAGSFSAPEAYAYTGPSFTQFLEAYAYINAIGCPDGFRSVYDTYEPWGGNDF